MASRLDELKADLIRGERHFNQEIIELVYLSKCAVQWSDQLPKSRRALIAKTLDQVKSSSDAFLVILERFWDKKYSLDRVLKAYHLHFQSCDHLVTYCTQLQETQIVLNTAGLHDPSIQKALTSDKFHLDRAVLPLNRLLVTLDILHEMKMILADTTRRVDFYHCTQCIELISQIYARCKKILSSVSGTNYVDMLEETMKIANRQRTSSPSLNLSCDIPTSEVNSKPPSKILPEIPKKPFHLTKFALRKLAVTNNVDVSLEKCSKEVKSDDDVICSSNEIVRSPQKESFTNSISVYPDSDSFMDDIMELIILDSDGNVIPQEGYLGGNKIYESNSEVTLNSSSHLLRKRFSGDFIVFQNRLKDDVEMVERRLSEIKVGVDFAEDKLDTSCVCEKSPEEVEELGSDSTFGEALLGVSVLTGFSEYPSSSMPKISEVDILRYKDDDIYETVSFKNGRGRIVSRNGVKRNPSTVNLSQIRSRTARSLLRNSIKSLPMYQSYYEEGDLNSPRFARRNVVDRTLTPMLSRKIVGDTDITRKVSKDNIMDKRKYQKLEDDDELSSNEMDILTSVTDSGILNVNDLIEYDSEDEYVDMNKLSLEAQAQRVEYISMMDLDESEESDDGFGDVDENIYESVHDLAEALRKEAEEEEMKKRKSNDSFVRKANQLFNFGWCQLAEVEKHGLPDKMTKQQRNLQEAKYEIISSKVSYLKSLSVLQAVFVDSPGILEAMPVRDYDILFQYVQPLKRCSEHFLTDLLSGWPHDLLLSNMQKVVHEYARAGLEVYVQFCSNKRRMDETLKNIRSTQPKINAIIKKLEEDEIVEKHALESFLLLPVQRITRYPLLVDAILKRLDAGSEEHTKWLETKHLLQKVAKECDDAVGLSTEEDIAFGVRTRNKDPYAKRDSSSYHSTFYVSLHSGDTATKVRNFFSVERRQRKKTTSESDV